MGNSTHTQTPQEREQSKKTRRAVSQNRVLLVFFCARHHTYLHLHLFRWLLHAIISIKQLVICSPGAVCPIMLAFCALLRSNDVHPYRFVLIVQLKSLRYPCLLCTYETRLLRLLYSGSLCFSL